MIRFFMLLLISTLLFGAKVENFRWKNGETYLVFLQKNNLPTRELYYNLDKTDQQQTEEILSGVHSQILRGDDGKIQQVLVPLNDELQIHIYKKGTHYYFEEIPIISETKIKTLTLKIKYSPYIDILRATKSHKLAKIFISSFKHSLNFKSGIRKDDTLAMIYEQKYRLGKSFSMPTLKVAMIELRGKRHFIYLNSDDRYYDEKGSQVEEFLLIRPVRGGRISSYFTKRRWHPILHKYRAHLGIDYAVPRGTPIRAAADGVITRRGRSSSYGNIIYIRHADGYSTRYAHQKSFRRGQYVGKHVKRGQVIGYVGTTGHSTGPHLHFELRKYGVAINPLKVVQVTTKKLRGRKRKKFLRLKKRYNRAIEKQIKNGTSYEREIDFPSVCYFNNQILKKIKSNGQDRFHNRP